MCLLHFYCVVKRVYYVVNVLCVRTVSHPPSLVVGVDSHKDPALQSWWHPFRKAERPFLASAEWPSSINISRAIRWFSPEKNPTPRAVWSFSLSPILLTPLRGRTLLLMNLKKPCSSLSRDYLHSKETGSKQRSFKEGLCWVHRSFKEGLWWFALFFFCLTNGEVHLFWKEEGKGREYKEDNYWDGLLGSLIRTEAKRWPQIENVKLSDQKFWAHSLDQPRTALNVCPNPILLQCGEILLISEPPGRESQTAGCLWWKFSLPEPSPSLV